MARRWRQCGRIGDEEWERLHPPTEIPQPAPRPPMAFAYIRCSHQKSEESGLGLDVQRQETELYYQLIRLHPDYPGLEWGGFWEDLVVSAYTTDFLRRKGGAALDLELRPNDHVLFYRLDRGFRNAEDILATHRKWSARGVTLHFVHERIDMNQGSGELTATILAAVAKMEARNTSDRCKAVHAYLIANGKPVGKCPYGFKDVGKKPNRKRIPDPVQRQIGQEIVRVRDAYGWGFPRISDYLEGYLAPASNRAVIPPSPFKKRYWNTWRCSYAYEMEQKYQSMDI